MFFDFLKKKECANCKKVVRKTINYGGYNVCSADCMVNLLKDYSTEQLVELDLKDREINKDYYKWVYDYDKWLHRYKVLLIGFIMLMVPPTIIDIKGKDWLGLTVDMIVIFYNVRLLNEMSKHK